MARKLSDAMQGDAQSNVDPTIIQSCLAEYARVDTEMKRLAQQTAAILRRYEGQGVNIRSIKATHKAAKLDKSAARAQAQSDMRYLIIAGVLHPADDQWVRDVSQSSLFGADEDTETIGTVSPDLARARAHSDGYNSGRHGGEQINNPFQAGSLQFAAWEEGRRDGADDRSLKVGGNVKVADTVTKRKRGRPPGPSKKRDTNGAGDAAHA